MPLRLARTTIAFATSTCLAACSSVPTTSESHPVAEPVAVPITQASMTSSVELAAPLVQHSDLTPPWSLTASDGSGLTLTRVDAKAVAVGPLAFTELHLYFHNSEARRREGTFQIALPPHASIARFAMENEGKWMEAEVVTKQLARRAYDDFLHRRQDPALLEKAEGNQFTAKVFPILPNADKHIVIAFSQELPAARYTLGLRGLPKIARVDVELAVTGSDGKRMSEKLNQHDWQPDRDFVSSASLATAAVAAGPLVAAQVAVFGSQLENAPATDLPRAITLLVDTSASRALGYERYVHDIHELVGQLAQRYGAALPLDVVAFDQDTQAVFSGTAGAYGDTSDRALVTRGAAGASDLGQALASLHLQHHSRVVVVTDAMITAGHERVELAAQIKQLADADRFDVVLAGALRDPDLAGGLVHAGLPHAGAVLDLDDGAEPIARELGDQVAVDVPVEVAGALWTYPRTIATARPGTTTMVYARMSAPTRLLDIKVGNDHRQLAVVAADAPLVERAVASAEIDELEQRVASSKPEDARTLRTELAKRAVATRVVTSETSMLVLESDDDYARYGIDRRALADVLVVGPHGVENSHREPLQLAAADVPSTSDPMKLAEAQRAAASTKTEVELARKFAKHTGDSGTDSPSAARDKDHRESAADEESVDGVMGGKGGGIDQDSLGAPGGQQAQAGLPLPMAEAPASVTGAAPAPVMVAVAAPPPPPPAVPQPPEYHSASTGRGMAVAQNPGPEPLEQRPPAAPSAPAASATAWPSSDGVAPLTGDLATIESALRVHNVDSALTKARAWHTRAPGDVLALIGMGDALEAKGDLPTAARMYGSIIDLFPGRADLRRFAGERLERLAARDTAAWSLIVDTYRRAVADRPDHVTGHRLLAYALLRSGKLADAFSTILAGFDHGYPVGRFAGWERVLGDDAGLIGAAYAASAPAERAHVLAELAKRELAITTKPSTRFILYWETDGNDVDFHIRDSRGGHAWYASKQLPSGGELYEDITTGYGPECFAIPGIAAAGPYHLAINYFSQGPMGYGMGLVEIQKFDGNGKLVFEDRPYVVMQDHAFVDLGTYR